MNKNNKVIVIGWIGIDDFRMDDGPGSDKGDIFSDNLI